MKAKLSQHTPGPWHIGMNPGPLVYGPNGEQVADLRAPMTPKDEALANLRLIVAAPDSHEANIDSEAAITEALAEAHRLNDAARETVFNPAVFQLLGAALKKNRAAISKAQGA